MKSWHFALYHIARKHDEDLYRLHEGMADGEGPQWFPRSVMTPSLHPEIDFLEANYNNPLLMLVDYITYE